MYLMYQKVLYYDALLFQNVWERCMTKNYRPINLFSIFGKIYEKFASNRLADKLAICGLFSDFQFGFRSFCSTTDILTVVSDRIIRVFIRDGAN